MKEGTVWAVAIIALAVVVIVFAVTSYYEDNVTPLRMAEKGYCRSLVPVTHGVRTVYTPCAPAEKK